MLEDVASKFAIDGKSVGWFSPKYKYMQGSFRRLKSNLKPIVERASATDGIIELTTGGIIRFWTLEDEDAGRGDSYDEVIIDEASLVAKGMRDIWEQSISPTLLDRDGNAWMSGTPKGVDDDNFFYFACKNKESSLAQVWEEFHAPTSANPHISKKALTEFKEQLPPLVYQQEVLAEFVDWAGVAFFSLQSLLVDNQPVQYPKNCHSCFAVVDSAIKDGKEHDGTAVTFYAYDDIRGHIPLTILDWDILQIEGALLEDWLPSVFARLQELENLCNVRYNNGCVWIEDKASGSILIQQAKRKALNAKAIPSEFSAISKSERAISVSGDVYTGKVKFSEYAYIKTKAFKGASRNHLLSQVTGFRIGVDNKFDDLLDTFTYGLLLTADKKAKKK